MKTVYGCSKKVLTFLLVATSLLAFELTSTAQTVTIGTGTSTQRRPFGHLYGYERGAALYTAAEVNSIGTVTSLAWYNGYASASTACPTVIYLKKTTSTTITNDTWANLTSGAVLAYPSTSFSFPASSGWTTFTLTTGITLAAGEGLLVLCETNYGGSGGGTNPGLRYTTSASGLFYYWYADTNPPTGTGTSSTLRPNIQIAGLTALPAPPTAFMAATNSISQIDLSWTANATPDPVLIVYNSTNTFGTPVAGTTYSVGDPIPGGGTVLYEGASPTSHTGLSAGQTVYYRAFSHSGTLYSGGASAVGMTAIGSFPYTQNFDGVTAPALPGGWTVENTNGDTPKWLTSTSYPRSSPNSMYITYNLSLDMNDWFFSPMLYLVGGNTYDVHFWYRNSGTTFPEKLEVKWGTTATSAGMVNGPIFDNNNILTSTYVEGVGSFTPPTTGYYFVGWHGYSAMDEYYLCVDDITIMKQPAVELSMVSWLAPFSGCAMGEQDVTVRYTNNGTLPQNNYTLSYSLDNGATWTDEPVTTVINQHDTLTYTFTAKGDFTATGTYTCLAKVTVAGDEIPANDQVAKTIISDSLIAVTADFPYANSWETGAGSWHSGLVQVANDWVLGTPAKTTIIGANTGDNAWVTKTTGNASVQYSYVESPCFDMTSLVAPFVQFYLWYELNAGNNGAYLAIKAPNDINYYFVGDVGDPTNWYNANIAGPYPMWAGNSGEYVKVRHNLTDFMSFFTDLSAVKFRLYLYGASSPVGEGVAFDDFLLSESDKLAVVVPDMNIQLTIGDTLKTKVIGGDPGSYAFDWSPTTGLSDPHAQNPVANPPTSTTYTVTVTDASKALAVASGTVWVFDPLVVNAEYNTTVCETNVTQLHAFVSGGLPPYTYTWTPAATISDPSIPDPLASPTTTTTYHVVVTDDAGFEASDDVTVTTIEGYATVDVFPKPASYCQGDSVLLTATGGLSYTWTANYGGAIIHPVNAAQSSVWVQNPGNYPVKYTVTAINPVCGTATDFVWVSVNPLPVVPNFDLVLDNACEYAAPVLLENVYTYPNGVFSSDHFGEVWQDYFWPTLASVGTHTITFTVENQYGCTASATDVFTVKPQPEIYITHNDVEDPPQLCLGDAVTLTGNGGETGMYVWSNGETTDAITVSPSVTTMYYVTGTLNGCENVDSLLVTVNELPLANAGSDLTMCYGTTDTLRGSASGGLLPYTWLWTPATYLDATNIFNPAITPLTTGELTYVLQVTDDNGCFTTDTVVVTVNELPDYMLSVDPPTAAVCDGDEVSVHIEFIAGTGPWTFRWADGVDTLVRTTDTPWDTTFVPAATTTYEFIDLVDANGCLRTFNDFATLTVNPLPDTFNVTISGGVSGTGTTKHYCYGDSDFAPVIGLDGSEVGVDYQLFLDGEEVVGALVSGTGSEIDFGQQFEGGIYTVVGTSTTAPTFCVTDQAGSAEIVVDTLRALITANTEEICFGYEAFLHVGIYDTAYSPGPYSYDWYEGTVIPTNLPDVVANPTASEWIVVRVASFSEGCVAIDSIYITVNDLPVVDAGDDFQICRGLDGTQILAEATGLDPLTYEWTPATGLDDPAILQPVANPVSNTTYILKVTDGNGCFNTDDVAVTVRSAPEVSINPSGPSEFCWGDDLELFAVVTAGSGSYTYLWSTSETTPSILVDAAGTYTVTVYDPSYECYGYATIDVTMNIPPFVELGEGYNICNGSEATLLGNIYDGGTEPFTYAWYNLGNPTEIGNTNPFIVIPPDNSVSFYLLIVTDSKGCSGGDWIDITTSSIPVAHASADTTICEGSCAQLVASGGPTYLWHIWDGANVLPFDGDDSTSNMPVVCPTETTTYMVTTNSACGPASTYVTVTVTPKTDVTIDPIGPYCQTWMYAYLMTGTPAGGWFDAEGWYIYYDGGDFYFWPYSATDGTLVTYYYIDPVTGCEYSASTTAVVNDTEANFTEEYYEVCEGDAPFALTVIPTGGTFDGPFTDPVTGIFDPTVSGPGEFWVYYNYTDPVNGCTDSDDVLVVVDPLPAAYTLEQEGGVLIGGIVYYCDGSQGVKLTLSGSQDYFEYPVRYDLFLTDGNGVNHWTGISQNGNGLPLDFGYVTSTGTYFVVATNEETGCTTLMTGSIHIDKAPLPYVYNVSGGGHECQNTAHHVPVITLNNSNTDIYYQLFRNPGGQIQAKIGVDGTLTFTDGSIANTPGTYVYTIKGVNALTGCERWMNGSATVTIDPLPVQQEVLVENEGWYCPGTGGLPICLGTTQTGVDYQLYLNGGIVTGALLHGDGAAMCFANQTAPGTYTVQATSVPWGCISMMLNSVTIHLYDLVAINGQPQDYTLDEGGWAEFCVDATGSNLTYQWQESIDGGINFTDLTEVYPYSNVNSPCLDIDPAAYEMDGYIYKCVVTGQCDEKETNAATLHVNPIVVVTIGGPQSGGELVECAGDLIVPVYVHHADHIAAISLTLNYDNSALTWVDVTDWNPVLTTLGCQYWGPESNASGGSVKMSWFTMDVNPGCTEMNLGDGLLCNIVFHSDGSAFSDFHWDVETQAACEFDRYDNSKLTAVYNDGSITVLPLPETEVTSNSIVCQNETIYLDAETTNGQEPFSYVWEGPDNFEGYGPSVSVPDAQPGVNDGTYTVTVTDYNGCQYVASTDVVVKPRPQHYLVMTADGGEVGYACYGSGVEIRLNGWQAGVLYQLLDQYNNIVSAVYVDPADLPANSWITFGPVGVSGTYHAVGSWVVPPACPEPMDGVVDIVIYPLPLWFNVTGGGHYCANTNGVNIGLSGSQIGVQYQLGFHPTCCACAPDSLIGAPIFGTGSPIPAAWHNITMPGFYSVVAYNPTTHCTIGMINCVEVKIDPIPNGNISGGGSVCFGSTTTSNNITMCATAGKAPWTFHLSDGTTYATTGSQTCITVVKNPSVTTTYTITEIVDANGCHNTNLTPPSSATITIWPLPTVQCGSNTPVCYGSTVNLTATATGFGTITYLWAGTGINSGNQNQQNPQISGLAVGSYSYSVTVTDGHGCSNVCQTSVIVNALPTLTPSANTPCEGNDLTLFSNATGYETLSYLWSGQGITTTPGPANQNQANPVISGLSAGSYNYTVTVVDGHSCQRTATLVATVNPLPTAYTMTGGGAYCEGGAGLPIGLANSQVGVKYQLIYNGSPIGSLVDGTGAALGFGTFTGAGTYTVHAYFAATQCARDFGQVTIVINPLPPLCEITGGGEYCYGCDGVHVGLSCSCAGISYQLRVNGNNIGAPILGSSIDCQGVIDFGLQTTPGAYTVMATNVTTGCQRLMSGTVTITVRPLPTVSIAPDTANICLGECTDLTLTFTGIPPFKFVITDFVTFDTIENITGYTYTYHVCPTVTTKYLVHEVSDALCYNNMHDSSLVIVNPLPNQYHIYGGGFLCNVGLDVCLTGSQIGVTYTLYRDGILFTQAAPIAGTGAAICFHNVDQLGEYTIKGSFGTTGCGRFMIGHVYIEQGQLPPQHNVTGGGAYCINEIPLTGKPVGLDGSDIGVTYYLLFNGLPTAAPAVAGTGYPISFGNQTAVGTYTVQAYNSQYCSQLMIGSAVITVNQPPTITTSGTTEICRGQSTQICFAFTGTGPWTFTYFDGSSHTQTTGTSPWCKIVSPTSTTVYKALYVYDANGCWVEGSDSAIVTVTYPHAYTILGGGAYCLGDATGVTISLDGSDLNVNYQLYLNLVPVGAPLAGTGGVISWTNLTAPGVYTVIATQTTGLLCTNLMNGSATVTVNELPLKHCVKGGGDCCVGCSNVIIYMDTTQYGISYQLYRNGVALGLPVIGNGGFYSWGPQTVEGDYTVVGTNLQTGCHRLMCGTPHVYIYPLPTVTITGSTGVCINHCATLHFAFTGTAPFSFVLHHGTTNDTIENILTNTYDMQVCPTVTTTYSLLWVTDAYCFNQAQGSATITIYTLPQVSLNLNVHSVCGTTAPAFALSGGVGIPGGGTGVYSGDGVDPLTGIFTPSVAGLGSHTITYTYTDPYGCVNAATDVIWVREVPTCTFNTGTFCITAPPATLQSNHTSGTWSLTTNTPPYVSHPGLTPNTNGTAVFYPSVAGVGTWRVTYTYYDQYECTCSLSQEIIVTDLTGVSFTGLSAYYCYGDASTVTLTGSPQPGTFSIDGTPLAGNTFSPASYGLGTHSVTYTGSGSCTGSQTQTFLIRGLPNLCTVTGGGTCCPSCNTMIVSLSCSQLGVNYILFRNGVAVDTVAGTGSGFDFPSEDITLSGHYTVVAYDAYGCTRTMNGWADVTYFDFPTAVMSGSTTICTGGSATIHVALTGTPPFRFLFSDGIHPAYWIHVQGGASAWDSIVHPTVSTTYYVQSVFDAHCFNNGSGSATITVAPMPEMYEVEGGGSYCPGGNGVEITLSGSQSGVYYELYLNDATTGQVVPGTGNAISFGLHTGIGTYTVHALGTAVCPALMTGSVTVDTYDAPAAFAVNGGGSYCLGGAGLAVGLAGSESGVDYQLYLGGVAVGSTVPGTGSAISFGTQLNAGIYTAVGSNGDGCVTNMTGNAVIVVNPLPNMFDVIGGGSYCVPGSVEIGLNGSQNGVNYTLFFEGAPTANVVTGTGSPISFGQVSGIGTYTVLAHIASTGCEVMMGGSVDVTAYPAPANFTVTGGGAYCEGGNGVAIGLSGSEGLTSYTLYLGATAVTTVNGNGSAISFGLQLAAGTYSVAATNQFGCIATMGNTVTITINPVPVVTFGPLEPVCSGDQPFALTGGTPSGGVYTGTGVQGGMFYPNVAGVGEHYITYTYSNGYCSNAVTTPLLVNQTPTVTLAAIAGVCADAPVFTLTGGSPAGGVYSGEGVSGGMFDPSVAGVGIHPVTYTYTENGCTNSATVEVEVYAVPVVFNVNGGGSYCAGGNGVDITLSGSESGVTYHLLLGMTEEATLIGDGNPLVFHVTYPGVYTIDAHNAHCSALMVGSVSVAVNPVPVANAGDDVTIIIGNSTQLNGTATGGTLPYSFEWMPAAGLSDPMIADPVATPTETTTYELMVTDANGCTSFDEMTVEVLNIVANIYGTLTYENGAATAMTNMPVVLKDEGGNIVAMTSTDDAGNYQFTDIVPGTYMVDGENITSKPWGGGNSNDALLILKHYVGISLLNGLKLEAADVTYPIPGVNATDALFVAERFVNMITSFPAGDWVYEKNTVIIPPTGGDQVNNFKALCFGDVNGSYLPPTAKRIPTMSLSTQGVKEITSYQAFELPIYVTRSMTVGAVSLVLNLPENLSVEGVLLNNSAAKDLIYTFENGELRIGWYNLNAIALNANDPLVTLQLRAKQVTGDLNITLDAVSELGNSEAVVIPNVDLTMPKLAIASGEYSISNYPNPFSKVTTLVYTMPESGRVNLRVYNLIGEEVAVLVNNEFKDASTYKVNFDGTNMVPGIYTYKIEVTGMSKDFVKTGRMVLSK